MIRETVFNIVFLVGCYKIGELYSKGAKFFKKKKLNKKNIKELFNHLF